MVEAEAQVDELAAELQRVLSKLFSVLRRGDANRRARERDWALDSAGSIHRWMQPDLELSDSELEEVQRRTIEALPPMCRRAYMMARDGELTYDEIGRTLGVTPATICYHVAEAKRRFRHELHAYGVARIA